MPSIGEATGYRLRATIDWIELRVEFPTPSQVRHLRRRMPPHWSPGWVKALERPESSRVFQFRVQDPNPATLLDELRQIAPNPCSFDPCSARVTAIEIALDAIPQTQEQRQRLAQMTADMMRHHARPPAEAPRITRPGEFTAAARPRSVLAALDDGFTINGGDQDAPYRARYYVKRHDTINGVAYDPLPPEQHRARMEVTLSNDRCPIQTVAELQKFRFETLARYLYFVQETPHASPFIELLQAELVQLGKPLDTARLAAHRRTTRVGIPRDTRMNQRVADALRALTKRIQNAGFHEESDEEFRAASPEGCEIAPPVLNTLIHLDGTRASSPSPTNLRQNDTSAMTQTLHPLSGKDPDP